MAEITPLSKDAFVTMAMCEECKKPFGITVDKVSNRLFKFVWSFKIDVDKAHREGYDATHVRGDVTEDARYPGCPHCGSKQWYICTNCSTIVCYHGQSYVTCPKCGTSGEITSVEEIDLKGGSY